jgi:hypothetical protein
MLLVLVEQADGQQTAAPQKEQGRHEGLSWRQPNEHRAQLQGRWSDAAA